MRELSSAVELTGDDRDYIEAALPGFYAPTRTTYARDLARFASFFEPESGGRLRVLDRFLELDAPAAHALTWNYREHMARAELGPATINRRLSALRAFCKRAQQTGRIVWSLEVPGLDPPPAKLYLVTPGDVAHLIAELSTGPAALEPRRARDACAIRLTWDLGLRRSELLLLDVVDVDEAQALLWVRKKGATDKRAIPLPERSQNALARWLAARSEAGPLATPALFVQFETMPAIERLSERGYYAMVCRRSRQILGHEISPHALRHAAITCALDATNGNVARVGTAFANHADIRTTMRYDDMRRGDGARIAQLVSESVPEPSPSTLASSSASLRISASRRLEAAVPQRTSAARSAILAHSSFDGIGRLDRRGPPVVVGGEEAPTCAACGGSDGGSDGFQAVNGALFCSDCWGI